MARERYLLAKAGWLSLEDLSCFSSDRFFYLTPLFWSWVYGTLLDSALFLIMRVGLLCFEVSVVGESTMLYLL